MYYFSPPLITYKTTQLDNHKAIIRSIDTLKFYSRPAEPGRAKWDNLQKWYFGALEKNIYDEGPMAFFLIITSPQLLFLNISSFLVEKN